MNSDMSMRTIALSSSNRKRASALVSSVLPTPVGPRKRNAAERTVRVLKPRARAAHRGRDGADGFVLPDHALRQRRLHAEQFLALAFQHPVDGDAGPLADHRGDIVRGDFLAEHRIARGRLRFLKPLFEPGIVP
jgi:hypothetical protein